METHIHELIKVLKKTIVLKELPRSGWILEGATKNDSDTVAAHSWSVAFISLLVYNFLKSSYPEIDLKKILSIAVLHDTVECITGELDIGFKRILNKVLKTKNVSDKVEEYVFSKLFEGHIDSQELLLAPQKNLWVNSGSGKFPSV